MTYNLNAQPKKRTGIASYYSNKFEGRKTASGERYSKIHFTAASNNYPLGTYLKVTNPSNKKSICVKVNDRMGANSKRLIDLSLCAARSLCIVESGICNVEVEQIDSKQWESIEYLTESDTLHADFEK